MNKINILIKNKLIMIKSFSLFIFENEMLKNNFYKRVDIF
jgi:hypothetical protein